MTRDVESAQHLLTTEEACHTMRKFLQCLLQKCKPEDLHSIVASQDIIDTLSASQPGATNFLLIHAEEISEAWNASSLMSRQLNVSEKKELVKAIRLLSYISDSRGDRRCCNTASRLSMKIAMQSALSLTISVLLAMYVFTDLDKRKLPVILGTFFALLFLFTTGSYCLSEYYFNYKMNCFFLFTPNHALSNYERLNYKLAALETYFGVHPHLENERMLASLQAN